MMQLLDKWQRGYSKMTAHNWRIVYNVVECTNCTYRYVQALTRIEIKIPPTCEDFIAEEMARRLIGEDTQVPEGPWIAL
jgi:hypothetical protein